MPLHEDTEDSRELTDVGAKRLRATVDDYEKSLWMQAARLQR